MALVFIQDSEIEVAVAVREAAAADGHTAEILSDLDALERRAGEAAVFALVLTGDPRAREARRQIAGLASRIPRPPIIAVVHPDHAAEVGSHADDLDLDAVLMSPVDPAEIKVALTQELERFELQLETGIVGRTDAIREILERIHTIASVNSTVLITGESGTGKELAARAIHRLSPRRSRPFIAVNCSAIPESLLESELFGHEKGAFTGATSRRKGMFELADGGTLLLDEIGEMAPGLQTRLLRILETRRFMRVGGDVEIEVNVRVIAATNKRLRESVRVGSFRKDLYYRINVLHVDLPPLRHRRRDIPILVRRFIDELSKTHDREFKGLSAEAMQFLLEYEWPGNVRELRNLIESMVVLAPGSIIRAEDILLDVRETSGRALLPVSSGDPYALLVQDRSEGASPLPQMDFLFRTLVEMKIDLDDLRSEWDRFRSRYSAGEATAWDTVAGEAMPMDSKFSGIAAIEVSGGREDEFGTQPSIRIEPGMTMADIERQAIAIALACVAGNRRKAAERLGIGERTLYRKIKEYGIDE
ncbi:MAG: sigma-54-dependent Fis family transcriptional regulator [Gemmatimonadales bacterium]|nr:MAG: sigma-54-dependent Fis family transcriptional regulator [Gemmatimonadales bacterium]